MDFIDLKKIIRKDSPIHYINEYHGDIIYSVDGKTLTCQLEIILEKTAIGTTNIQVHFYKDAPEELRSKPDLLIEFINEKFKAGYFSE
jgi:hypothetical protein